MKKPPLPSNEIQRIANLDGLDIIYSPAEERFDRITRLARNIFNVPIALISLITQKCQWFKSAQGLTAAETPREISFCGHAILSEDTLVVMDTLLNPDFADNPLVTNDPHIRFYAGHPIAYDGTHLGTLCIIDRVPRKLLPRDLETLRSLTGWVENELKVTALSQAQRQLVSERDEARRSALIDPLTKVWNRKGMDELLVSELSHAARQKQQVVLMLLDVDHYKAVNDNYGHVVGDIALQEVAQRIRSSVRPYDVIARYGGDEFLVFAPDCAENRGIMLAERILARVNSEPLKEGEIEFTLSLSIGFSIAKASQDLKVKKMIELADAALYEAKDAGRNCVKHRSLD